NRAYERSQINKNNKEKNKKAHSRKQTAVRSSTKAMRWRWGAGAECSVLPSGRFIPRIPQKVHHLNHPSTPPAP
ncbi:MAG: hypothetical protein IKC51_01500, partial [Myxococcaceae bacterium]|nr:hypothetical protein [Myxococcaceae bacterium]